MSGKANTTKKAKAVPLARRPKRGTVTKASARGVKVSTAKTPRPDKRTPAGRKRQAKQARGDRTNRAAARPVDREVRAELSDHESQRSETLKDILRVTHEKACRLLGVTPDDAALVDRRGLDPRPMHLADGLYLLAVRSAGFRISDYANHHNRPPLAEGLLATSELWSQVHYLFKNTEAYLAGSPKSPMVSAARAALVALTTYATSRMSALERRMGPRPGARNKPSEAPVRAKRKVAAVAKRKAKMRKPAEAPAPPVVPADPEQVPMAFGTATDMEGYLPCPTHGIHSFPSKPCYMCGWKPPPSTEPTP